MSTSTRKPGTGATSTTRYSGDSATSGNAWTNPGNITVEDATNATNTGGTGQGRYLIGTNFGFSAVILPGATINSITGRYKRAKTSGTPTEAGCVLVGPSGLVSSEMNNSSAYPATTLTDRTFTATFTGTTADVLDAAFGLSIKQTGAGNVQVDVMELTIDYTNPPVLTPTGSNLAYAENAAATAVDSGITCTADAANLTGATISIGTGFHSAEDALSFSTQNGISGSYNSGTGVMTLSGTASVANYQTALRDVKYANSSDDPNTTSRVVTFTATDGTRTSASVTRTIDITASNDAPVVTCSGGTTSQTQNAAAVEVDTGLTLSDADNVTLAGATVEITGNFSSGDVLSFSNQLGITGSWNSGTHVLTLSGTVTKASYQTALRDVKFATSSSSAATRTVTFIVSDGAANSAGSTKDIGVTPAMSNAAPVVTCSVGATAYTSGNAPKVIDSGVTITDSDDANIESAIIQITGNLHNQEDYIRFQVTGNITGAYDPGTGKLTLTGTDTKANWQAMLRSLTFYNVNPSASTQTRTVSFTVNDGDDDSNTSTKTITVAQGGFTYDVEPAHNLTGHGVVNAMHGAYARSMIVVYHDQDDAADPAYPYSTFMYQLATPRGGVIGASGGGVIDPLIQLPIILSADSSDLTGVDLGTVQYPMNRLRTPWVDVDAGDALRYNSLIYDTSATAGDGTTPGIIGNVIPLASQEIIPNGVDFLGDNQELYTAQLLGIGGDNDAWATDELEIIYAYHGPAEDQSGVLPIDGAMSLELGLYRGFDTPTFSGILITGGVPNEISFATAVMPAGADLPRYSVTSSPGEGGNNRTRRTIPVFSAMRSRTRTKGIVIVPFANPYTGSLDLSLNAPPGIEPSTWRQVATALGGVQGIVVRAGGFVDQGVATASDLDMLNGALDTTSDLYGGTGPYGEYRAAFSESWVDAVYNLQNQMGGSTGSRPVLLVQSHFTGLGRTVYEAEQIIATMRKSLKWAIDQPGYTPYHASPPQVWLVNCALLCPWADVSVMDILTGAGAGKYVRKNCTTWKGPWLASTAYSVGDGVLRPQADAPLRGNSGYMVCKRAHTSSASSGIDGPPEDDSQTGWDYMDFALNDNGKQREIEMLWQEIEDAFTEGSPTHRPSAPHMIAQRARGAAR